MEVRKRKFVAHRKKKRCLVKGKWENIRVGVNINEKRADIH